MSATHSDISNTHIAASEIWDTNGATMPISETCACMGRMWVTIPREVSPAWARLCDSQLHAPLKLRVE